MAEENGQAENGEKAADSAASPESAPAAPRRGFFLSGNVLASLLTLTFVAIFALSVYQFEFWSTYFFRGTIDVSGECTVAVMRTDFFRSLKAMQALPVKPIAVPHGRDALYDSAAGEARDPYVAALYRCPITTTNFGEEDGVINLHTGWIVGEKAEVYVNSTPRASFVKLGKPAIPLRTEDLVGGRSMIEVLVHARKGEGFGLIGLTKMVVAKGTSLNARVLGVDFALSNQKMLYTLLPLLTLGLTLVFGWTIGIRTRMMTVTFFFLMSSSLRNVVTMFADFWPWPFEATFWLQDVFFQGGILAFILFSAEMLGLCREWILRGMGAVTTLILLFSVLVVTLLPGWQLVRTGAFVMTIVDSMLMISLIVAAVWRRAEAEEESPSAQAVRRTRKFMIGLALFVLCALWLDAILGDVFKLSFRLSPQVEKILPLFVAAILFFTLYLIEQALREERETRAKMETELSIAAKLQGVLVPKDLSGRSQGFHYEIQSKPHGILGGDWVRVHSGAKSALFVLGDVVGKGPSAALTHSGIAASWESQIKLWERGAVTTQELLTAVNGTMYDLYQGTMNSTFAFAEVTDDGKARLAAGGNHWLHINAKKSLAVPIAGRALLGLKQDFAVQLREVDLAPGDWLICFTDGVLEGGRPISRFIRAVQGEFDKLDNDKLKSMLSEAGRGEVHPDDASILLLRFVGEKGANQAA